MDNIKKYYASRNKKYIFKNYDKILLSETDFKNINNKDVVCHNKIKIFFQDNKFDSDPFTDTNIYLYCAIDILDNNMNYINGIKIEAERMTISQENHYKCLKFIKKINVGTILSYYERFSPTYNDIFFNEEIKTFNEISDHKLVRYSQPDHIIAQDILKYEDLAGYLLLSAFKNNYLIFFGEEPISYIFFKIQHKSLEIWDFNCKNDKYANISNIYSILMFSLAKWNELTIINYNKDKFQFKECSSIKKNIEPPLEKKISIELLDNGIKPDNLTPVKNLYVYRGEEIEIKNTDNYKLYDGDNVYSNLKSLKIDYLTPCLLKFDQNNEFKIHVVSGIQELFINLFSNIRAYLTNSNENTMLKISFLVKQICDFLYAKLYMLNDQFNDTLNTLMHTLKTTLMSIIVNILKDTSLRDENFDKTLGNLNKNFGLFLDGINLVVYNFFYSESVAIILNDWKILINYIVALQNDVAKYYTLVNNFSKLFMGFVNKNPKSNDYEKKIILTENQMILCLESILTKIENVIDIELVMYLLHDLQKKQHKTIRLLSNIRHETISLYNKDEIKYDANIPLFQLTWNLMDVYKSKFIIKNDKNLLSSIESISKNLKQNTQSLENLYENTIMSRKMIVDILYNKYNHLEYGHIGLYDAEISYSNKFELLTLVKNAVKNNMVSENDYDSINKYIKDITDKSESCYLADSNSSLNWNQLLETIIHFNSTKKMNNKKTKDYYSTFLNIEAYLKTLLDKNSIVKEDLNIAKLFTDIVYLYVDNDGNNGIINTILDEFISHIENNYGKVATDDNDGIIKHERNYKINFSSESNLLEATRINILNKLKFNIKSVSLKNIIFTYLNTIKLLIEDEKQKVIKSNLHVMNDIYYRISKMFGSYVVSNLDYNTVINIYTKNLNIVNNDIELNFHDLGNCLFDELNSENIKLSISKFSNLLLE